MPIHGLKSLGKVNPPHFNIENVIRPNILSLHPYRCARDDYSEGILLDANENALGHSIPKPTSASREEGLTADLVDTLDLDLHRYPDPSHPKIKSRIAALRGLPSTEYVFLGVGSDEVIDLLMRVCVVPGKEKIVITPPTYGMYAVCAQVNDVGVVKVPLELSNVNGEGGDKGRFSVRVDEVFSLFSIQGGQIETVIRFLKLQLQIQISNSSSSAHPETQLQLSYLSPPSTPSVLHPPSKASSS